MARPGAVGFPAEPEPIRVGFLLEEQPEHARLPGSLLVRARSPQPVQQGDHEVGVIEGHGLRVIGVTTASGS